MAVQGETQGADNAAATSSRHWQMGDKAFSARMPHHEGIKALWETKWKMPCQRSVYPFHDGSFEDFESIFGQLIKNQINDGTAVEYTQAFLPIAERLEVAADQILRDDVPDPKKASSLYLRACAVLRIARFPYITAQPEVNCQVKWDAWERQKRIYLKAAKLWDQPVMEIQVPFTKKLRESNSAPSKLQDRDQIPVYVRLPTRTSSEGQSCPVVILMTGLDGYRPDNTQRCDEFLKRGWGSVVVEIPGTADCPADPSDPESPDRLWSSLLDWMAEVKLFDTRKIMVWGLSAGGYYAVRIAHTHRDKLLGVVAQGAGVHHMFDSTWIEAADGHEYPFRLSPAMAMKHGFGSVDSYKSEAQKKFSLLENGVLDQPSCKLLLVNGTHDGLMPIEDSIMLLEHGSPKEARFFPNALHMGYPDANASVYPWMEAVMATSQ